MIKASEKSGLLYISYNVRLKELCRQMRSSPTDAERKLWKILKMGQLNQLRFNRQKPLGNYIVDFYCSKAQLVIEVDGGIHLEKEQRTYDKVRTEFLNDCNLTVLRFWNNEVMDNPEGVYEKIIQAIQESPLAPLLQEGNKE